ncbi:MAG: hypothetical protein RIS52_2519, partial [Pseudomonadota bacterium]
NAFFLGDHFEYRVPIDDENTLSVSWMFNCVPKEQETYRQSVIPAWRGPIKNAVTGRWISSHVMNQDFIAWVGQGTIADRTKENLGTSDKGIALMRRRLLSEAKVAADGGDPKGTIRDPAMNIAIPLPNPYRDMFKRGLTLAEIRAHPVFGKHLDAFMFQAGQPLEVWRAFREAMGLPPTEIMEILPDLV